MSEATAWKNRIVGHGEEAPGDLLANPLNWRVHPQAQQDALGAVLDRVGWVQDVIVNRRSGHVVDGHLRVSLAIAREEAAVPVKYVDLSDEEERLVLASLDPLGAMAVTDEEMLAQLLEGIETEGALAAMLEAVAFKAHPKAGQTDPDAIPEPPAPTSKLGDLWLLGEHRLLCGDATNADDFARLMDGRLAAVMWTDPPYGVSYFGKTAEALTIQNDSADGLERLLLEAFGAAGSALEPGAPFYIAHPPAAQHLDFWLAVRNAGWSAHEELVWVKDSMVLGHMDYHSRHESIIYGWTPGPGRSGRGKHEGSRWHGDHAQTSVFEIERPKASREHPTMKPVGLIEGCLANSSLPGAVVLEPFAGSGSTIIAAERLGRRCYAMEIEPRYVDVAVRRWEEFTGGSAVLDGR